MSDSNISASAAALPSFLVQTGPRAYTLTFSASGADTLSICEYKFAWKYVTGIEAARTQAGPNYGKAIHLCLEERYRHPELSLAEVEAAVIPILEAHFAANPQPATDGKGRAEWRTMARALQAFAAYNRAYPVEQWEVLGVEEPFDVVLGAFEAELGGAPATVTVKVRGIRDLRVQWHNRLWVVDHKTSREWGSGAIDEGKCSFQFMLYAWVERFASDLRSTRDALDNGGESEFCVDKVGGAIGNYLISREPYADPNRKPSPRDLPRDQFERHEFPFSDAQLDEWHARAMRIARRIWDCWRSEEWDQRSTGCAHWGRCEYYQLCWEVDPAYRMAAAMAGDYRPRTPGPLDDADNGGRER